MRRALAGVLISGLVLSGCALFTVPTPTVRFDRGNFALMYSDFKSLYSVLAVRIGDACAKKKFDADACAAFARAGDQIAALEIPIRRAITDPSVEVDWEALANTAKLLVGLAARFI